MNISEAALEYFWLLENKRIHKQINSNLPIMAAFWVVYSTRNGPRYRHPELQVGVGQSRLNYRIICHHSQHHFLWENQFHIHDDIDGLMMAY